MNSIKKLHGKRHFPDIRNLALSTLDQFLSEAELAGFQRGLAIAEKLMTLFTLQPETKRQKKLREMAEHLFEVEQKRNLQGWE